MIDRQRRRQQVMIDEALDHAEAIMAEGGAGALTISEIARRMGMRGPSLYKYFASLHAVYDALFARGQRALHDAIWAAIEPLPRGVDRIRAGTRVTVRWSVDNPALAQLMFWRPIPGFEPSPDTFEASVADTRDVRAELAEAVRRGQLDASADSDEAVRLLTVMMSGLISQQMANQPGAAYESGVFTSLTDEVIELYLAHYRPRGGPDADTGP